ncbi:MAG: hypothetical protein LBT36_00500 [Oscillospiraceae bacterium]|jgi:hypothetical protein|nr:hypothetical protein [Oscillospiraceae bacterium]
MSDISAVGAIVTQLPLTQTSNGAASGTANASGSGLDFSQMLADALEQEMVEASIMASGGSASASSSSSYSAATGGTSAYSGGGMEQIILAAAASGEVSDAQIALFMLMSMMESGAGEDGEFSQLMSLMGTMLTQLQADTGADTSTLRGTAMRADYSPDVLGRIDAEVFNIPAPSVSGTGEAVLPLEVWKPAVPAVTNAEDERSAESLRAVIDQFNVETAERYEPYRDGYTYCNIFVWDVTSALGAEIPHYIDPATGAPMEYPDVKGASQLGAVATESWLLEYGARYGWYEADAETAQRYANEGKPAVTTAGSVGHVQVVCPSVTGELDPVRGVSVSQAGSKVRNYAYLSDIYSANGRKGVKYFVHE